MQEGRSVLKILTGTPIGKRLLGRPSCRWEDNIRMGVKEVGVNTRNWVDSAQDRDYCECRIETRGSKSQGSSRRH